MLALALPPPFPHLHHHVVVAALMMMMLLLLMMMMRCKMMRLLDRKDACEWTAYREGVEGPIAEVSHSAADSDDDDDDDDDDDGTPLL